MTLKALDTCGKSMCGLLGLAKYDQSSPMQSMALHWLSTPQQNTCSWLSFQAHVHVTYTFLCVQVYAEVVVYLCVLDNDQGS